MICFSGTEALTQVNLCVNFNVGKAELQFVNQVFKIEYLLS